MIDRYSYPKMKALWREKEKLKIWLKIELLVCEAKEKFGTYPQGITEEIKKKIKIPYKKIKDLEKQNRHEMIAFVEGISLTVGSMAHYLHQGLTSSDILDTATAVMMTKAAGYIISGLEELAKQLKKQAVKHKETVMIGRTHGVHAEPITLGLKFLNWHAETLRNLERMKQAKETIMVGKISGAVGTYSLINPEVEAYVCRKLGLKPALISSQIIQRDRHAEYLTTLAIIAGFIEKVALQLRLLQITEVGEAGEQFTSQQKGSSAMPHKKNPITCEQLCGLAKIIRSNSLVALENIALWHERDLSHSSPERFILPQSAILTDYMLRKLYDLVANLVVNKEKMQANIELSKGTFFSSRFLAELLEKGWPQDKAYRKMQTISFQTQNNNLSFLELLQSDEEITALFKTEELEEMCKIENFLKNTSSIYQRFKI